MNIIRKTVCIAAAIFACFTGTLTAFADETPTYSKEDAWQAIQDTNLEDAARIYDIDCVDIDELTTEDLQLFFDIYWRKYSDNSDYPSTIEYYKEKFFSGINSSFYGTTPINERLQEIYQQAQEMGYDTTAAYNSHTWDTSGKSDSSTDSFADPYYTTDATTTAAVNTEDAGAITEAEMLPQSTAAVADTQSEEDNKTSPLPFVILGVVIVAGVTVFIISFRKERK